ncbi:hypothetical protein [Lysinibacillus sphaericus]|uniref:hypothetical protein n=1 Tax=Lysinibacillus sphaericus TaxID=1421 RepID=UPI0004DEE9CC|nr:hypothetical protein [Lysinibacillus sphaericus]QPA60567.1 hypothetical protein INQ55_09655 [Lysinibacillus sphaericus]
MDLILLLLLFFPLIPLGLFLISISDFAVLDFFERLHITFKNKRCKLFKDYNYLLKVFESTDRYLNEDVNDFKTIVRESGLETNYKTLFLKDVFVKYGPELEKSKHQLEYMQSGDKRSINKTVILESEKIIRENVEKIFYQMILDFENYQQEIANKVKNEANNLLNEF